MNKTRTTKRPRTEGLLDLFGHTYVDDPEYPEERAIQYQFKIIRTFGPDRYIVQYFSWWDGDPTNLGVMTEAELLGPDVKLYAHEDLWRTCAEEVNEQRRQRRWAQRDQEREQLRLVQSEK